MAIPDQMLAVLADGKPHTKDELLKLCDPLGKRAQVANQLYYARKKLPPNEDILCVVRNKRLCFMHVRLLAGVSRG